MKILSLKSPWLWPRYNIGLLDKLQNNSIMCKQNIVLFKPVILALKLNLDAIKMYLWKKRKFLAQEVHKLQPKWTNTERHRYMKIEKYKHMETDLDGKKDEHIYPVSYIHFTKKNYHYNLT